MEKPLPEKHNEKDFELEMQSLGRWLGESCNVMFRVSLQFGTVKTYHELGLVRERLFEISERIGEAMEWSDEE